MKIMKKSMISKLGAVLVLLTTATLLSGCVNRDNEIWYSDVRYIDGAKNHAAILELGKTLQLSATTTDGQAVKWESSDESVATVDQTGLVTPVALGETTITAFPKVFEYFCNGNYVVVTVIDTKVGFVDDAIDQSEAE